VAKAKSNASAKPPAKTSTKRKTSPAKSGENSAPARKASVESQPSISTEQIGHVAGDVWRVLDKERVQSLAALKKATGASNELVLAAIGWLAREDKLDFTAIGRAVKIALRQ
jgi:hypothetical protein